MLLEIIYQSKFENVYSNKTFRTDQVLSNTYCVMKKSTVQVVAIFINLMQQLKCLPT